MEKKNTKVLPYSNFFRNPFQTLRNYLFPITRKEKNKRFLQVKDVSIFFFSVVLFFYLEDKIAKYLTVNPEEVQKLTQSQNFNS